MTWIGGVINEMKIFGHVGAYSISHQKMKIKEFCGQPTEIKS